MPAGKRIVYVLKSESDPRRYDTGLTSNLSARLDAHNAGHCSHTASDRPWIVDLDCAFQRAEVCRRADVDERGCGRDAYSSPRDVRSGAVIARAADPRDRSIRGF